MCRSDQREQKNDHLEVFDLGFIDLTKMDGKKRCFLVCRKHYRPPKGYPFPVTIQNNNVNDKRKPSHEHLDTFDWLEFSHAAQGLFCLPCALMWSFSKYSDAQYKTHKLGPLVMEPLTSFIGLVGVNKKDGKPRGKLNRYTTSAAHHHAVTTFLNLCQGMRSHSRVIGIVVH